MPELSAQLPEIIAAAAKSPLGIFALMIISLAILGFFFFREAAERTRIAIFVMLFVGVAVFGLSIVRTTSAAPEPASAEPGAATATTSSASTKPADDSIKTLLGSWKADVTYYPPRSFAESFDFELVGGELIADVTFLSSPRDALNAKVENGAVRFDIRRREIGSETRDILSSYTGQIHPDRIDFVMRNDNGDPAVRFQATRKPVP